MSEPVVTFSYETPDGREIAPRELFTDEWAVDHVSYHGEALSDCDLTMRRVYDEGDTLSVNGTALRVPRGRWEFDLKVGGLDAIPSGIVIHIRKR